MYPLDSRKCAKVDFSIVIISFGAWIFVKLMDFDFDFDKGRKEIYKDFFWNHYLKTDGALLFSFLKEPQQKSMKIIIEKFHQTWISQACIFQIWKKLCTKKFNGKPPCPYHLHRARSDAIIKVF